MMPKNSNVSVRFGALWPIIWTLVEWTEGLSLQAAIHGDAIIEINKKLQQANRCMIAEQMGVHKRLMVTVRGS